jgi:hypothetical protein
MQSKDSLLTQEILENLKQGTKVEFKWWGSKSLYIGRIEVDKYGDLYFVGESNYTNEVRSEGMRYYNSLDSFFVIHISKL